MNASKKKRPVIFGEVLFDHFSDGSRVLGGAPFNVAWHLQALGCEPLIISRIGVDDGGKEVLGAMEQWGMALRGLQRDVLHPTGAVEVALENGQPSFAIVDDCAYDHIEARAIPSLAPSLIYHGTLALRHNRTAKALQSLLQHNPAPRFIDVNLRPPWWQLDEVGRLLDGARWVKLNDSELKRLVAGAMGLEERAGALQQRHDIDTLIVTLGAEGAFAIDKQGQIHRAAVRGGPVEQIKVVDTVGAGDAFSAVAIVGLLGGWELPMILERAAHFAALIVAQRGATVGQLGHYQRLLESWESSQL